jgi:hypothetical protein
MISHFLKLEWKQYFRSSHWQKGIALKIIMGLFVLYFVAVFLAVGIGGYYIPRFRSVTICKLLFIVCRFRRFDLSLFNAKVTGNEY